jgi:putative FmdB family regulatory protein
MPIYEYKCAKCGEVSEFLVGVTRENTIVKCKHCGSAEMTKLISSVHVSSGSGMIGSQHGKTCCGREERCEKPPCSDDGSCKR